MDKIQNARLRCMLSYNQKRVVIFRKGPTKWTQLILWDLENNSFEEGQWLHGSVYEDKSDISPDGKYISIAIAKYSIKDIKESHSWTTISKPPFFTSLFTFLEKEGQAKGGYFENENNFTYNGKKENIITKGKLSEKKLMISFQTHSSHMSIAGEHPLNEKRLTKNGWLTTQQWEGNHHTTIEPQIKVKKVNSNLSIIMERTISNFDRSVKYLLKKNGTITKINGAQWMDIDFKKRLLLAKNGKVFIQDTSVNNEIDFKELIDFNNSKPKEVEPSEDCLNW